MKENPHDLNRAPRSVGICWRRKLKVRRRRWPLLLGFFLPSLVACGPSSRVSPNSTSTPQEQAYLPNIEVTHAKMMAARNLLGERIVTLDADIVNKGSRTVRYVKLELQFMDLYGKKVVFQTSAVPVSTQDPPLKPSETRPFSVSFEHVSPDWNQAPPRAVPIRVIF